MTKKLFLAYIAFEVFLGVFALGIWLTTGVSASDILEDLMDDLVMGMLGIPDAD